MTSLVLESGARAVFHTMLVFSLYLLFTGHNAPGGGFVGGLVAASAMVLLYVALGHRQLRAHVRVRPPALIGAGVILAVGTGAAGWMIGGHFLHSGKLVATLPLLGEIAVMSALMFDAGVYLVVVGLVLAFLRTLGAEMGVDGEEPTG